MYLSICNRKLKKILNLRTLIVLVISMILLYNEIICYYVDTFFWCDIQCESSNKSACTRILLVADPQIIGEDDGDVITIWDSDRYLYSTYQHAVKHFKPEVIVFLGDLIDEGSISTDKQYNRYLLRFGNIFNLEYPVQFIYIPGDNDIGGEFGDWITPAKIYRFEQILSKNQSNRIDYSETLSFYKINRLVQQYLHIIDIDENVIRIALSHMPLIRGLFIDNMVQKIRPHVIFSGHMHTPLMTNIDEDAKYNIPTNIDLNVNKIYKADLSLGGIFEFIVPTCSYRMGVPHMGYGAAVLDIDKQELNYTIFWLHSRFRSLWMYVYTIVCTIVIIFCVLIFKCISSRHRIQTSVDYLKA